MEKITTLQRALAVASAKEKINVQNAAKIDSTFTFEGKGFTELLASLTKQETKMDAHAEIKMFNKVVEDRGYDFFSQESMADWMKNYGSISEKDIFDKAEEDTKRFLYAVQTAMHPEHEQNRLVFASSFGGDEAKVKTFFYENRKEEMGRKFRPMKDFAYEGRTLTYRAATPHEAFEYKTFTDLMRAKWAAVGYYADAEYKKRFVEEYCIAIKELK